LRLCIEDAEDAAAERDYNAARIAERHLPGGMSGRVVGQRSDTFLKSMASRRASVKRVWLDRGIDE
jgi:hypothetical protein